MPLIQLAPNQPPDRFYAGGAQIRRFRPDAAAGTHVPEDWIGSSTCVLGESRLGLTVLPDGRVLRDAFAADPVEWFGSDHANRYGADPYLLVKVLDAGERLPVHAHPSRAFAGEHLGLAHGKTEAWVALTSAEVRLGFRRDISPQELAAWVAEQNVPAVLDAMHTMTVEAGDAVLVPAGLPHAIGAGALFVELQEPTDLSILVEWDGFAIDGAARGHLGLGFDAALAALDRNAWTAAQIQRLRAATADSVGDLIPEASEFFRVERWRAPATWQPGYAVAVVTAGQAELRPGDGRAVTVRAGQAWLLPHAVGEVEVAGDAFEILRCRPPAKSWTGTRGRGTP